MCSELDYALLVANRVLDRPNADPDDDLAVLARQLLRRTENNEALRDQHRDDSQAIHSLLETLDRHQSHPDQTSPMTVGPEAQYDDELDALRQRCRWAENNARSFQHECREALDRAEKAEEALDAVGKLDRLRVIEINKLRADLQSWEITAKRISEADFLDLSLAPERSAAAIARDALAAYRMTKEALYRAEDRARNAEERLSEIGGHISD